MAEEKAKKTMNPALKQSLTAVAVLVIICLVCGLLLALCNDLLYVSPEEKFNRTIRKVYSGYGADVTFKKLDSLDANYKSDARYGEILEVREASDGSYVLTSKGTVGAFGGGSVTILVAVGPNPEAKILGWALQENEGQTFIANITEKHQKTWFVGSTVSDVQPNVTPNAGQGKGSGATYTENALANAINMACYYCQNVLGLGENPEGDAKKAILELLGDEYSGYTFTNASDEEFLASCSVNEQELFMYFVGTKDNADSLEAYVYGEDENRQIVILNEMASREDRLAGNALVKKSEGIADELVTAAQNNIYADFKIKPNYADFEFDGCEIISSQFSYDNGTVDKIYKSTNGAVVIETTGTGGFARGTVTIDVVINDGVIESWWIVSDVSQSYLGDILKAWDTVKNWYVGSSINENIELTDDNKFTGVTMSSTAINNAVNTACKYAREVLLAKEGA